MHSPDTAILLFSRSLGDEFRAKSFSLNFNQFKQLYLTLIRKVRNTLSSSGLPVFEINSDQQFGDSFGERLINALEKIKAQGFHKVIVVGNDAPALSVQLIEKAISSLDSGRQVLGEDIHGGCYLIGLDTRKVVLGDLKNISWHSSLVYEQTRSLLNEVTELPMLADLNKPGDLKNKVSKFTLKSGFRWLLHQLLFEPIIFYPVKYSFSHSSRIFSPVLRGPPSPRIY